MYICRELEYYIYKEGDGHQTWHSFIYFSRMNIFFFFCQFPFNTFSKRRIQTQYRWKIKYNEVNHHHVVQPFVVETDTSRNTFTHTCLVICAPMCITHHLVFVAVEKKIPFSFRLEYFYDIFPLLFRRVFTIRIYSITTGSSQSHSRRRRKKKGFTRFTPGRFYPLARARPLTLPTYRAQRAMMRCSSQRIITITSLTITDMFSIAPSRRNDGEIYWWRGDRQRTQPFDSFFLLYSLIISIHLSIYMAIESTRRSL